MLARVPPNYARQPAMSPDDLSRALVQPGRAPINAHALIGARGPKIPTPPAIAVGWIISPLS
jgi:hypothetical protein